MSRRSKDVTMEASSPCNPCTLPRLFFLLATFYRAYTLQFPVNSSFSVPRNFRSKSLEEKKAERRKTVSSETSVVQARPSHVCLGRSHFSWRRGSKDAATLLGEMPKCTRGYDWKMVCTHIVIYLHIILLCSGVTCVNNTMDTHQWPSFVTHVVTKHWHIWISVTYLPTRVAKRSMRRIVRRLRRWQRELKRLQKQVGTGCGKVGRTVASDATNPQFSSSPRQFFV